MRAPIVSICWAQAARIRRQERDIAELVTAYRTALDDLDAQETVAAAWRARALSLYLIADPHLRTGVMRAHTDIDQMGETR
jgi:hypothetical protein